MKLDIYICNISKLENSLVTILSEAFHLDKSLLPLQISKSLGNLISRIKPQSWSLIEYPYVDKIYRDSYYHYYSSKYGRYNRECIKVSLFQDKISYEDFRRESSFEKLSKNYLGFFVIRPTEPAFLGRNIINPKAFNTPSFEYCTHEFKTTVNGIKLKAVGFPHSSQDGETISCAETTLWALMEYFGEKYADYKPIKPSKIHSILNNIISERSIPSRGLTITQISYVLKEMGFGCRIYSKEEYGEDEFYRLLNCYIESGIPLAVGMDDFDNPDSNKIGHAVIVIGKTLANNKVSKIEYNKRLPKELSDFLHAKNIDFYDCNNITKELIFIDDNQPPYQPAMINLPVAHYDKMWANVTIKHFVAPLYTKIYLEAYEAMNFVKEFIFKGPNPLEGYQQVLLRFYLASSRTFKHKLAYSDMQTDIRDLILENSMPKFIWIAELSNHHLFIEKKCNGLLVIDATEPSISDNKPLIFAAYQNSIMFFDGDKNILTKYSLPLQSFTVFLNNLQRTG